MNTALATAPLAPPSPVSLAPRPDQPERWTAFRDAPVSFDEAATRIMAAHHADGVRDDVATTHLGAWAFGSVDNATMQIVRVPFAGRDVGEPLALREHAFAQLCTRVGAPAPYIRELPAKLQIANMNWGLAQDRGPALLRLAGGEVRAILSDRYAAADDPLLLEMVASCLDRTGYRRDARVRALAVGSSTVLRITLPTEGVAVRSGDVIEHGIDIGNSEIGIRSVQVTPVTYRLICTNGMRAWRSEASVRLRHIGDPKRLHDQLRDAIPVAFAEARGDLDLWRRAVDRLVDDALAEVEGLRGFGLATGDIQAVGRELVGDTRPTSDAIRGLLEARRVPVFDVANAITAIAREKPTSTRLLLEEAGHRYLSRRAA